MDLTTEGLTHNKGYRLMLKHLSRDAFPDAINDASRFKLVLVESGSCIINLNITREFLTAPLLLCLNDTDRMTTEEQSRLETQSLFFHPSVINCKFDFDNIRKPEGFSPTEQQDCYLLNTFILRGSGFEGIIKLKPAYHTRFAAIFNALRDELGNQADNAWPCRSRSLLLELLILTDKIRDEGSVRQEKPDESLIDILTYLQTHYAEKITVSSLERKFNLNRTTLNRNFLKATKFPVIEYLIRLRIQVASSLMRDTRLPVSEIMERAGFSNYTHFWRMFSKHMGFSPREYRRRYCWMEEERK